MSCRPRALTRRYRDFLEPRNSTGVPRQSTRCETKENSHFIMEKLNGYAVHFPVSIPQDSEQSNPVQSESCLSAGASPERGQPEIGRTTSAKGVCGSPQWGVVMTRNDVSFLGSKSASGASYLLVKDKFHIQERRKRL